MDDVFSPCLEMNTLVVLFVTVDIALSGALKLQSQCSDCTDETT